MNPEIEKLIDLALADGEITDKERSVILKNAVKLGEDPDEVEMILDGRFHESKKLKTKEKVGNIKTCPSCGSPVKSFISKCQDCGHEFRDIKSVSSIQKLYDEFQKIEEFERSRERSWAQKIDGDLGVQRSVVSRQIAALATFPVPNSKEDLLEFLSLASSEAIKKASWLFGLGQSPEYLLQKAWRSKCEQIIKKSRFSMKDDKKTLDEIEFIAKQLKIK